MHIVTRLVLAFILFVLLELGWLHITEKCFHNQVIDVQRVVMTPDYRVLAFTLVVLFAGLYLFIINKRRPVVEAAVLGAFVYGVYGLANKVAFKKWRWSTVLKKTVWGSVLFSATTAAYYYAGAL